MPVIDVKAYGLIPASEICVQVPGTELPNFRASLAIQRKVQNQILLIVGGGLGDTICTEPTIRYACNTFQDCEISVATYWPEVYEHLPLKKVYNLLKKETPELSDYFYFRTIESGDCLKSEFLVHMLTHVIDYHSLAAFRVQLPPKEKHVSVPITEEEFNKVDSLIGDSRSVAIHPGFTWQSRTLPPFWWNEIIERLTRNQLCPVIIGSTDRTVKVNTEGCLDLRDKLSIRESIALSQLVETVITNDSSPLHMAATGNAWIAFVSTVKRPDLLLHFRNGQMGYRMRDFSLGGFWQEWDMRPFNAIPIQFEQVDPAKLLSWLPKPAEVVDWVLEKIS